MNLSCLPVSLFSNIIKGEISLKQWIVFADEIGLDGFDISAMFFTDHTASSMELFKQQFNSSRLPLVMVATYPDFTNPDKMERKRQVDYLKRDIAFASKFGAKYIRITAGQNHQGLSIEEGSSFCAECFETASKAASDYCVQLLFENHGKPGAWPLVDFSHNPEAFLAVCEKIKHLPIGINFDTANAKAYCQNPIKLLESIIDRVVTIHMNDTSTIGYLSSVLLGTGLVNFSEIFNLLKKHNFKGWVCIEEASNRGFKGIKDATDFARRFVPKNSV